MTELRDDVVRVIAWMYETTRAYGWIIIDPADEETVERVARAIWDSIARPNLRDWDAENHWTATRDRYKEHARAALAALAEEVSGDA